MENHCLSHAVTYLQWLFSHVQQDILMEVFCQGCRAHLCYIVSLYVNVHHYISWSEFSIPVQ